MAGAGAGRSGRLEDVYRIVRQAIETRRPISAVYEGHPRLFCPHRLGRNKEGDLRVLCYQFGGTSRSGLKPPGSPDNWRCIAVDKLSGVKLLKGAWQTAPNHSRPASCIADADVDAEDYPERNPQQGQ
jgi:hypothetical protein